MAKKIFLVEIEFTGVDQWYVKDGEPLYANGDSVIIPVMTNNAYNAKRKVDNSFCGSEYPSFNIKSVEKCDEFLFKPIL